MSYVGLGKLREALAPGDFTDSSGPPDPPSNTAADLPDVNLTDQIAEADALIDAAIGSRYTVPVELVSGEAPAPINFWSRAIAAYLATCTQRGSQDFSNEDPIYRRYITATAALDAVAKGTYSLNLPATGASNAGSGAGPPVNPYYGDLFTTDDFSLGLDYGWRDELGCGWR